jgi:DNA-binding CsgD family transcriptional regulator
MKSLCRVLIPHVDSTLRRIEVLPEGVQANHAHRKLETLSVREAEIMHWVSIGKTNLEIGQILGISHNTAKNHLRRIFKKLNVANRAQAVARLKRR